MRGRNHQQIPRRAIAAVGAHAILSPVLVISLLAGSKFRARSTVSQRVKNGPLHIGPTARTGNYVESTHLHYRPVGAFANVFGHHRYNTGRSFQANQLQEFIEC